MNKINYYIIIFIFIIFIKSLFSALIIQNHSEQKHDRFYVGADKDFIADELDLSGVGEATSKVPPGFTPWGTAISKCHLLTSSHMVPTIGMTYRFHHTNDPKGNFEEISVADVIHVAGTDISIVKLNKNLSENIKIYSIVNPNWIFQGDEIYTLGRDNNPAPGSQRVGKNKISAIIKKRVQRAHYINVIEWNFDKPGIGDDESSAQGGDSGAPSLKVISRGVYGITGIRWYKKRNPIGSGDSNISCYINEIRAIVSADGMDINVIPEQNPVFLIYLELISHLLAQTKKAFLL